MGYRILDEDTLWIATLACTPDGRWLAAGDEGGRLRVWSMAEQGRLVCDFRTPLRNVLHLALHPTGRWIAAVGNPGGTVWRIPEGESEWGIPPEGDEWIHAVAFSPDGGRLLVAGDSEFLRRYAWPSRAPEPRVRAGERNRSIAFHPDGRTFALAACCQGGSEVLFGDAHAPESGFRKERIAEDADHLSGMAFREDGRWLAVPGREVTLYEYPSLRRAHVFDYGGLRHETSPGGPIMLEIAWSAAAFAAPGWLACASPQRTSVFVWDPESGQMKAELDHGGQRVLGLAAPRDGRWLASAGEDGTLRLWNLAE